VRVYRPNPGGVLFVASAAPLAIERDTARAIALAPQAFRDVGIAVPEDLAAALALDDRGTRELAEGAPIATDDENHLATRSPRVLAHPLGVEGASALLEPLDPLVPPPPELDAVRLVERIAKGGLPARAMRVADAIPDPALRATARSALALAVGDHAQARSLAAAALVLDPQSERTQELAVAAELATAVERARSGALGPGPAALVAAREAAAAADWSRVAALDAALAAIDPRSPLAPEAVTLRARWRLARQDAAAAHEGLAIVDAVGEVFPSRDQLRLRAELAAAAGETSGALATWGELAQGGTRAERRTAVAKAAMLLRKATAEQLPPEERDAWTRDFALLERHIGPQGR
jgi:hypothetical protein